MAIETFDVIMSIAQGIGTLLVLLIIGLWLFGGYMFHFKEPTNNTVVGDDEIASTLIYMAPIVIALIVGALYVLGRIGGFVFGLLT